MKKVTFLDLFCGCGGFTLGLIRSGMQCLAAIDIDNEAVFTLRKNLTDINSYYPGKILNVLQRDLTIFSPADLSDIIKTRNVDVIIGGPPCQGFSNARQVDGANHGIRLKVDHRRSLYREFLNYVEFYKPFIFILENVLGFRTAAGGEYFTSVQREARRICDGNLKTGYRVHGQIENAWKLGVPQKRRRQFIIGVREDCHTYFNIHLNPAPRAIIPMNMGIAIGDLPELQAGEGNYESPYDLNKRKRHFSDLGELAIKFLTNVLEVDHADKLTNHIARPHSHRDLRDFSRLKEGETSLVAMRDRNVKFEFPYNKSNFKDRFTRQSRTNICSTIVAHLSKDGLMFIHPTQNRSLTPRESARIQSFPDWFRFPSSSTHAFRLIGNAVPPLVSEAFGLEVKAFLKGYFREIKKNVNLKIEKTFVHSSNLKTCKLKKMKKLSRLSIKALRKIPKYDFLLGWNGLLEIFNDLHPANALDHGKKNDIETVKYKKMNYIEKKYSRRFARSRWPVDLERIGSEAWRRYMLGEMSYSELFHFNNYKIKKIKKC